MCDLVERGSMGKGDELGRSPDGEQPQAETSEGSDGRVLVLGARSPRFRSSSEHTGIELRRVEGSERPVELGGSGVAHVSASGAKLAQSARATSGALRALPATSSGRPSHEMLPNR